MKKKIILSLLIISLGTKVITSSASSVVLADGSDSMISIETQSVRASRVLSGYGWRMGRTSFAYSLTFLSDVAGKGTVTLQKQSGSSWSNERSVEIEFSGVYSFDDVVLLSNSLSNGVYRLKFSFTKPYADTVYSSTITLS